VAIDKVRELFFDTDGRPNDLWKRFADSISLLSFQRPNINGAKPDTLAAVALFDQTGQQNVSDYLHGTGSYQTQGPGFFTNPTQAQQLAGANGDTGGFATTISALRIFVTVHDGKSQFRLAAVVAPPNGATTIQTTATSQKAQASAVTARNVTAKQNQPNASQARNPAPAGTGQNASANANARNLQYPFTLLEIRENDEIPPPPPAPPVQPI
jgi:general secretion pathway protein K